MREPMRACLPSRPGVRGQRSRQGTVTGGLHCWGTVMTQVAVPGFALKPITNYYWLAKASPIYSNAVGNRPERVIAAFIALYP
jgi:hypothetical protein